MRTINCTITTIAKALCANGLQIVRKTFVSQVAVSRVVRGVLAQVGQGYSRLGSSELAREVALLLSALRPLADGPACLAMHEPMRCKPGHADRLGWSLFDRQAMVLVGRGFTSHAGSPGNVSIG